VTKDRPVTTTGPPSIVGPTNMNSGSSEPSSPKKARTTTDASHRRTRLGTGRLHGGASACDERRRHLLRSARRVERPKHEPAALDRNRDAQAACESGLVRLASLPPCAVLFRDGVRERQLRTAPARPRPRVREAQLTLIA
jgi:hypothetical protein